MKITALPVHSFEDVTLNLEQLQTLLTLPAWTAPAFVNAWVSVTGRPAGYLKDGLGFVHLRGAIQTGATSTIAFSLPAGYRPANLSAYATFTGGSLSAGLVTVSSTGDVTVSYGSGGTNVALDSISFRAEN